MAGETYRFDLAVVPGALAINRKNGVRAFMVGRKPKGQIYTKTEFKKTQESVAEQLALEWSPREPLQGVIEVEIDTWWPRMNRSGAAAGQALGDVDAAGKALLDALAQAGVIGNDGQVSMLIQRKHHGKPRAEIRVRRVDPQGELV